MIPQDLKYTDEHEWLRTPGGAEGSIRVGVTDYAQEQLGDIVYVQLPDVGTTAAVGDAVGELESTKSVSEVYCPVAGEIVAVNEALNDAPELVNSDAFGEGWLFEIVPSDASATDSLLDAAAYQALIEG